MKKLKIFALNSTHSFGNQVAEKLGIPLSKHEEYYFDDGEPYCSSVENVRGCDVFVIQSLYTDKDESVNCKLNKLFIFLGSLKDASAKRVTAVIPYLAFSRQDRKTSSRAPITTKYIARLFKAMWTKRILSLDVHNPTAIQNACQIPVDLLEATNLFADWSKTNHSDNLCVLSPDSGGLGRARKFRQVLQKLISAEVGMACLDKIHAGREITGHDIMGDVRGKSVYIYDDLISSGKTVLECVEAVRKKGAKEVLAICASHGLFVGKANEYLDNSFLQKIVVTDTINPFRLTNESVLRKLHIINTTSLFAEAIKRIHQDQSISDLINNH